MSDRLTQWPHAPSHHLTAQGAYIVTAATYRKEHYFDSRSKLDLLQEALFFFAAENSVELQAWAIFLNHYHYVAQPTRPDRLSILANRLHSMTARKLNAMDGAPSRRVWFQYWETHLTYEKSYFARLHYVHRNPVHHGLVRSATRYPWCSAAWFESEAPLSFRKTVLSVPCDRIRIADEFTVQPASD